MRQKNNGELHCCHLREKASAAKSRTCSCLENFHVSMCCRFNFFLLYEQTVKQKSHWLKCKMSEALRKKTVLLLYLFLYFSWFRLLFSYLFALDFGLVNEQRWKLAILKKRNVFRHCWCWPYLKLLFKKVICFSAVLLPILIKNYILVKQIWA